MLENLEFQGYLKGCYGLSAIKLRELKKKKTTIPMPKNESLTLAGTNTTGLKHTQALPTEKT